MSSDCSTCLLYSKQRLVYEIFEGSTKLVGKPCGTFVNCSQLYYNTLEAIKAVVDLKAKTVVAQEKSVIDEGIANAFHNENNMTHCLIQWSLDWSIIVSWWQSRLDNFWFNLKFFKPISYIWS